MRHAQAAKERGRKGTREHEGRTRGTKHSEEREREMDGRGAAIKMQREARAKNSKLKIWERDKEQGERESRNEGKGGSDARRK
jgi:hypothetical protein